jgi:hypothetical protein
MVAHYAYFRALQVVTGSAKPKFFENEREPIYEARARNGGQLCMRIRSFLTRDSVESTASFNVLMCTPLALSARRWTHPTATC